MHRVYRVTFRYILAKLSPRGAAQGRRSERGWPLPRRCWAARFALTAAAPSATATA